MSIRDTLQTSGFYIHYNAENWESSSKNKDFLTSSFQQQKTQITSSFAKSADPDLFQKITTILNQQSKVVQSLLAMRTNISSLQSIAASGFSEGIKSAVNANQQFQPGTDTKLQQLIQTGGMNLNKLLYIEHFINSLEGTLDLLVTNNFITQEQFSILSQSFMQVVGMAPELASGGIGINQIAKQVEQFATLFSQAVSMHSQEIGVFIGNNLKELVSRELETMNISGPNQHIQYERTQSTGTPATQTASANNVYPEVTFSLNEVLNQVQGQLDITIIETNTSKPANKVSRSMFNTEGQLDYDEMFGGSGGLPPADWIMQNWFLNYYVHRISQLYANTIFMNYIKGRAAAVLASNSSQLLLFNYQGHLYSIEEMVAMFPEEINKYFQLTIAGSGQAANMWHGSKTRNMDDANTRSQMVYNEIRKSAQFTIRMHAHHS